MAAASLDGRQSLFRKMVTEIMQERGKVHPVEQTEDGFEHIPLEVNCFWARLFAQHFLEDTVEEIRDDMLFFVFRQVTKGPRLDIQPHLEVFRRDSKNLPSLGEPTVDWEETVYLNLILQQYTYTLTCGVCIKEEGTLTVLRKYSQQVYASPSRRQMDRKAEVSHMAYPFIFFMIDNFEEVFDNFHLQEGQLFCVELVAAEKQGPFRSVTFLGSVRYDALKKVFENRASVTSKVARKMSMGLYQEGRSRLEFIRMRGPESKGYAEVAVRQNAPSHESSFDDGEYVGRNEDHGSRESSRATTPDSSGSPRRFYFTPDSPCHKPYTETSKSQGGSPVHKSNKDTIYQVRRYSATGSPLHRSYTDGLQEYAGNHRTSQEDLRAQSDTEGDGSPDSSWRQRLFRRTSSALLRWKYRSTEDTALNVYLTYVTLPWHRIIGDVLEVRRKPILS
ncbi:uncharacterized protein KIAA0930 homolog [Apostichopus japonicus]|uniref:uncharacterized protein KIAA0930 homolog n=1 Tax=Stichopus japonicus TaxID=307972 RepID=UPI003AB5EEAE